MSVINLSMSVKDELLNYHDLNNNNTTYSSLQPPEPQQQQEENRLKQLYNQIEQLTLTNARLVRANRMLKLDCDRIVEEKTLELRQALKLSIEQNIRLQRSNRLLQYEYQQKSNELNDIKRDQIRKMKNVGPEYEYLVQVVNLLYRQSAGKSNCEETCCFTEKKSTRTKQQPQHYCRPTIKSHIQGGALVSRLEQENHQLMHDRDSLFTLLQDKEYELKVKDDIVKQLESDFTKMELEVSDLQKDWYGIPSSTSSSSDHHPELREFPSVPHTISFVQP